MQFLTCRVHFDQQTSSGSTQDVHPQPRTSTMRSLSIEPNPLVRPCTPLDYQGPVSAASVGRGKHLFYAPPVASEHHDNNCHYCCRMSKEAQG